MAVGTHAEAADVSRDKMPLHRKITYSFTDLSGNLLYCIISSYILFFFTDVYGLSVGVAGVLLLIARSLTRLMHQFGELSLIIRIVSMAKAARGFYGWRSLLQFLSGSYLQLRICPEQQKLLMPGLYIYWPA